MNTAITPIKRALISVSDKTNLTQFAQSLVAAGIEIISTGGTAKTLRDAGIPVIEISDFTGFPEMMDGRVKTLHPKVHGGILGLRDIHSEIAQKENIQWIDLVICNLYPFSKTIQKPHVSEDEAIEHIDIGGPSMIRSAAKNVGWVTVVVDPNDYTMVLEELTTHHGITFQTRKKLSAKAFGHTAQYDAIIHTYFNSESYPEALTLTYNKFYDLRYGENPHQTACVYKEPNNQNHTILNATIHQGKQLSYNNINDADGALALVREFNEPACVVVKHANPCGVAIGNDISEVFTRAYNADTLSAFGGVICLNRICTAAIAEHIAAVFAEIVIAPCYEPKALEILSQKKNLRVLETGTIDKPAAHQEFRHVEGGLLLQDSNVHLLTQADLKVVTTKIPSDEQLTTMLFAWNVLKYIKSNAILIAKENTTIGVGAGQVSRVDAVDTALKKAGDKIQNSILASDAFFPFRDSIDKIASTRPSNGQAGITAIIQPGGSIKDQEVIDACNEHGIAMVFTGVRCFKH